MGMPFTIQEDDNRRLESLKRPLKARTKVEVLRKALDTLEEKIRREQRMKHLKKVTRLVVKGSARINKEFRNNPLLARDW